MGEINIVLTPTKRDDRNKTSANLDETMTARKKNRAYERLMAFLNRDGYWVSAVALVDKTGKQIDHREQLERLDFIHYELKQLNKTLAELLEVFQ